jgi:hypothetical protein
MRFAHTNFVSADDPAVDLRIRFAYGPEPVKSRCKIFCSAAMVTSDGRKLPGRWPWAIIRGVQPSSFFWFQIFDEAPH